MSYSILGSSLAIDRVGEVRFSHLGEIEETYGVSTLLKEFFDDVRAPIGSVFFNPSMGSQFHLYENAEITSRIKNSLESELQRLLRKEDYQPYLDRSSIRLKTKMTSNSIQIAVFVLIQKIETHFIFDYQKSGYTIESI